MRLSLVLIGWNLLAQDYSSSRWYSLSRAMTGTRYIGVSTPSGGRIDQNQYQALFTGSLKLDARGRFRLNAGGGTGPYFSGGWNHSALGNAAGTGRLYWRDLYGSAEPWRGVEFQYGGMMVEPHGTGIAGLAPVGYATGQRMVLRRKEWGLDRIALTYGYLGDFDRPDVHHRFRRLGRGNYRDLLLEKRVRTVTLSYQATMFGGRQIISGGADVQLSSSSNLTLELYRRSGFEPGGGLHAGAGKAVGRWRFGGGYASIDRRFGGWNADNFWDGRRVYGSADMTLARGVVASLLYNHAAGNNYQPSMRKFLAVSVNYDVLALLRHQ